MNVSELIDLILEIIQMPFNYLVSPGKRVFIPYLFTSFFLALYVFFRVKERPSFKKYFLSKKRWLGTSAIIDYCLIFFNSFIKVVVLSPLLIYALYIAEGINKYFVATFSVFDDRFFAVTA